MKWTKISDQFPKENTEVLFYDGNIIVMLHSDGKSLHSAGYYCNNTRCLWTSDDCHCKITINEDDYWMPLPSQPERLSEKTPQGEATV